MAKKTIYNCAYLRVNLIEPWLKTDAGFEIARKKWLSEAETVLKSIKRHCDVESVTIKADIEVVCQFCGSAWTENDPFYNGGCCNKDEQDYQESISFAAAQEGE